MSNYFSIRFDDLTYTKQEDLIETVSQYLLDKWKAEVEKEGKDWMGNNWQEKYMRIYGIEIDMWQDDGDVERPYDWEYSLKEYSEEQAKLKIVTDIKYLELEVDCDN